MLNHFFSQLSGLFELIKESFKDHEFRALFLLVIMILGIGTIFYHNVEGLTYLDGLYLSVTTLATVGYGDIAPKTELGKIFTIFYIFAGLGIIAAFINTLSQQQIRAQLKRNEKFSHGVHRIKQKATLKLNK